MATKKKNRKNSRPPAKKNLTSDDIRVALLRMTVLALHLERNHGHLSTDLPETCTEVNERRM